MISLDIEKIFTTSLCCLSSPTNCTFILLSLELCSACVSDVIGSYHALNLLPADGALSYWLIGRLIQDGPSGARLAHHAMAAV